MSVHEANNQWDLLRLMPPPPPAVKLHGATEPQLAIGWGEFHQGVASNFAELFRWTRVPKDFLVNNPFKDSWIDSPLPRRAIVAAALWHIAFVLMPLPQISGPKRNPAFANAEITWSGPIEDFPLIEAPAAKPKPVARTAANVAVAETADAFHPRQRIFTDPVHPNHPRQTLIQPKAPLDAPKILSNLPNMVQLAQSLAPARPRLEISQKFLKQLHPRQKRLASDPNAPAPAVQLNEQRTADMMLAMNDAGPARPKLEINAGVAPRLAQRKLEGAAASEPDVAAQLASPNGAGQQTLIALSATPAPPAPVAPPPGNLAARVAISPEGKKPGAPGGAADPNANLSAAAGAGNGAGTNAVGVSISGGTPKSGSAVSGLDSAGKLSLPATRPNYSRAEAARAEDEPVVRSGPPNFAALAPDARPEAIFARRRVYSLNVNTPNLNSATGSWIFNFSVMRTAPTGPPSRSTEEIAEPSPLHTVDPKYPPTAMAEHIEGEVILYAVIRRDGSVESIQLVRGIDPELDANAMRALAQWKFRPAERSGQPVDLEAVVHIPFHAPERQY
jgi:TonB family protein